MCDLGEYHIINARSVELTDTERSTENGIMKPSLKVYLIILIGGCVILYQYYYYYSSVWIVGRPDSPQYLKDVLMKLQIESESNAMFREFLVQRVNELSDEIKTLKPKLKSTENPNELTQEIPPLYIITPTYRRPEQIAELTRMSQTLMHVPNLHWLLIEDAEERTPLVTDLLRRTRLKCDHLISPMPKKFQTKGVKPRGVSNRKRGLEWLRENATTGVFYFADDDNTYDLQLFEEMRYTKKVSMWPVGLITKFGISSPIVRDGKFVGFYDGWVAGRKFPVDMAGFAVSVKFLKERPNANMPFKPGYEEDEFLKSLAPFEPDEIELLADNCSKVLAWHTQAKKNAPSKPLDMTKYNNTNLVILKKIIV